MFLSDEEIPLASRYHIEAASLNWFSENTISVFFEWNFANFDGNPDRNDHIDIQLSNYTRH